MSNILYKWFIGLPDDPVMVIIGYTLSICFWLLLYKWYKGRQTEV